MKEYDIAMLTLDKTARACMVGICSCWYTGTAKAAEELEADEATLGASVLASLLNGKLFLAGVDVDDSSSSFTELDELFTKAGEKDRTGDRGEDGVESDDCIVNGWGTETLFLCSQTNPWLVVTPAAILSDTHSKYTVS